MPLLRRDFLTTLLASCALPATASGTPVIAAAASLRFALPQLIDAFRAQTGADIRVAFGSTGTLSQQIRNGAPFELFLSADESYVQELARDGFLSGQGAVYAMGRLAMIAPNADTLHVDPDLQGVRDALATGRLSRFAIASPSHAPYGKRAKEALVSQELWQLIEPHLVIGENVAQAAQFAVSGNAQGGIIAASLALSDQIAARGRHALITTSLHSPLRQRMALANSASKGAKNFYDYLQTEPARALFTQQGFATPEDY